MEVLEFLKGTDYWPASDEWQNTIMFLETSEEMMLPDYFRRALRNFAGQGLLKKINGIIVGRPFDNKYLEDYNKILLQIIKEEEGHDNLPIITEMDFGHTCPTFTLPIGATAEIDCDRRAFSIIENGVTE